MPRLGARPRGPVHPGSSRCARKPRRCARGRNPERLDPEGRQSPRSKRRSATAPPRWGQSRNTGCRCIGFQTGLVSIFSSSDPQTYLFPAHSEPIRIDGQGSEPTSVATPSSVRHEMDARYACQRRSVILEVGSPRCHPFLQHPQLSPPNRRQQVAHAVVVADLGVLIVRRWIASLRGKLRASLDEAGIVRDEHAPA